jgi:alpha-1,2-mannosyltransferase
MAPSARRWLIVVAIVCGLYGLFCAAVYAVNFSKQPWQDWMVYYTAARAYLDGNLPLIFDGERFTAQMNAAFADWLPHPLTFHPWLYPPPYLLLLIPFGLLPFATACVVFLSVTFACLLAAVWGTVESGYRRWLHAFSLILAPAVWFNVGSGQNAFLTSALLVGGFGLLPRRPVLAGILLGLLSYKPQLWLLAPVALVAARQWRALASAIAAASVMVLLSLAVFGLEPWRAWFEWFIAAPPEVYQTWLKWGRIHGESIYANLVMVGASHALATAGQNGATLLAAVCVWWCYRRAMPDDLRLAVLLAAAMLAAPHVTNYDAVLLVVAATLVFAYGLDHGFRRFGLIVPVLVWMIQLFNPPHEYRIGLVTPLLTAALIACAIAAARSAPVPSAAPIQDRPGRAIGAGL